MKQLGLGLYTTLQNNISGLLNGVECCCELYYQLGYNINLNRLILQCHSVYHFGDPGEMTVFPP